MKTRAYVTARSTASNGPKGSVCMLRKMPWACWSTCGTNNLSMKVDHESINFENSCQLLSLLIEIDRPSKLVMAIESNSLLGSGLPRPPPQTRPRAAYTAAACAARNSRGEPGSKNPDMKSLLQEHIWPLCPLYMISNGFPCLTTEIFKRKGIHCCYIVFHCSRENPICLGPR